jgi:hypothetical protein
MPRKLEALLDAQIPDHARAHELLRRYELLWTRIFEHRATIPATGMRRTFIAILLAVACAVRTAAKEARCGFYTPPAADTIHPDTDEAAPTTQEF